MVLYNWLLYGSHYIIPGPLLHYSVQQAAAKSASAERRRKFYTISLADKFQPVILIAFEVDREVSPLVCESLYIKLNLIETIYKGSE